MDSLLLMLLIKNLILNNNFFTFIKKNQNQPSNQNIVGKRGSQLIFLNENFFSSYIHCIFILLYIFKFNKNLIILDSRPLYQKFIKKAFKKIDHPIKPSYGQLSNYFVVRKFFLFHKKIKPLNRKPDLILILNLIENINLLKEASSLKIPVLCFYNGVKTYSNMYKISCIPSFRTFYLLTYSLKNILYFKFKLNLLNK